MKAMILAAGLGTRLKPFTNDHPKALAVVNGKTLIQRNIEYLATFGITDIIINLHHFGSQIRDFLSLHNNFKKNIFFSDETDQLLETGGGIKKASWFFNDCKPFLVMNVDILTDMNILDMVDNHINSNAIATVAVCDRITKRYFLFDEKFRLCGWRNVETGKEIITRKSAILINKAFSGIHIISPELLEYLHGDPNATIPERFSIVDPYLQIIKTRNILGYDHSGSKFIDVGRPESITEASALFE